MAGDAWKFDKGGIEGFDFAFGKIFEKTTQSDEMVSLSDGFEVFAVTVGFAIELKTIFAYEFSSNIFGREII